MTTATFSVSKSVSEVEAKQADAILMADEPITHAIAIPKSQQIYLWMAALFMTCLVIANLMGSLLFSIQAPFLSKPVILSSGIIAFPVTFILTDLINEFYGASGARRVTMIGFAMSIVAYVFLQIGEWVPALPDSPISRETYLQFSGSYTGMFVASLTAYLVGQFLDISLFGIFKRWTGSKLIWVRATGSTVVSQLFDSLVVTTIAFQGKLTWDLITQIMVNNYCWKFLVVLAITPLLYLGHMLLRKLLQVPKPAL